MRCLRSLLLLGILELSLTFDSSIYAGQHAIPSYADGFASNAAESAFPEDWVGLVAAYNPALGNSGTRLKDWAGRANTGIFATGTLKPIWGRGELGLHISYDGGDRITLQNEANFDFDSGDPFSIVIRIFPTTGNDRQFLTKRIVDEGYFLAWQGSGVDEVRAALIATGAGDRIIVDTTASFLNNRWHMIGFTYDGSSSASGVRIYVNGKDEPLTVIEDTLTGSILSDNVLALGRQLPGGGSGWIGDMQHLAIYNYELNGTQMYDQWVNPGRMWQLREEVFAPTIEVVVPPEPATQNAYVYWW